MEATRLDFRPFRAWRYDADKLNLSEVIAPPYDVISPAQREALYAKSPFNVVRLILGREPNFYENAAALWQDWSGEGVLIQESRPAVYLYEQTFHHPWDERPLNRLAIVGVLKLDESGAVLRHEATFDAPKKDRLLLLEKTKTNLSPIFGLYQNSTGLGDLFSIFQRKPPLFQARDDEGVVHRGWAIEREGDQKLIQETLLSEKILIADGHHRYETALNYQNQMHRQFPRLSGEQPFDFVMMALVASGDEGLLVLPTHRIVRSLAPSSEEELFKKLGEHFDLSPHPEKEIFSALLARAGNELVLGVVFQKRGSFLLQLKGHDSARYPVEASLLNHLVFDHLWGLGAERRQKLIEYTHASREAIDAVRRGKAEAAFLLRAPQIDTIRKLAYAGGRMPEKTTYFYPKLASGLLFYHHGS